MQMKAKPRIWVLLRAAQIGSTNVLWLWVARAATRTGSTNVLMNEFANWTPLMLAALWVKVAEVHLLLEAKLDLTPCDGRGLTALEVVRAQFGGIAPPILENLVGGNSQTYIMYME